MKVKDKVTRTITLDEEDIELFSKLATKILNNADSIGFSSKLQLTQGERNYLKALILDYEYSETTNPSDMEQGESVDSETDSIE